MRCAACGGELGFLPAEPERPHHMTGGGYVYRDHRVRVAAEDVHELQHHLIEVRRARLDAIERRSNRGKIARREAYKRFDGTMRGHLRQFHGFRQLPPLAGMKDLDAMHKVAHEREPEPAEAR